MGQPAAAALAPEYFLYEADKKLFEGLRLVGRTYEPIPPDKHGRFWSAQLGAYLGLWHGIWRCMETDWIRLFRADGSLVPSIDESAIEARRRTEAERRRAEAAEAELARLRALLEGRSQGS